MADLMPAHGPVSRIAASGQLVEVWGDVVDLRHLRVAVLIGPLISLGAYGAAVQLLSHHGGGSQVDRAYAMLFGLVGCLLACVVCSALLPPKRVLQDAEDAVSDRDVAIADLLKRSGGKDELVPTATIAELNDLGLYGLIPERHADDFTVPMAEVGAR
jgi:hypothetical protein